MEDFYKSMEGKSLVELAEEMNDIRLKLETAKAVKTSIQKKYDALRLNLIPSAMDDQGITSMHINGVGRLGITSDIYASIPASVKPDAWQWLCNNNLGGIIKPTINAGTLKATLKSIMREGKLMIPDGLFKITPFSRASITKK